MLTLISTQVATRKTFILARLNNFTNVNKLFAGRFRRILIEYFNQMLPSQHT